MKEEPEVKLCEVCWQLGDGLPVEARWYLKTLPVCDEHQGAVCGRCQRRWVTKLGQDGDSVFGVCDECYETLERLAARRNAYNQHLSSEQWRKTKKELRSQSVKEYGRVVCSRCRRSEYDNKQTYGEGLHGHHASYERFGREKPEDVELLCSLCHAWEHHLPTPKPIRNLQIENLKKAMH